MYFILALAASFRLAPQAPPLASLFQAVVDAGQTTAIGNTVKRRAAPAWLDTASVRTAAYSMGMAKPDIDLLLGSFNAKIQPSSKANALKCENEHGNCSVASDGYLLGIDSIARSANGIDVVVTHYSTDRRSRSNRTVLARVQIRYSFSASGTTWKLTAKQILRQT